MTNNSSRKRYPDELKMRAVKMVLELQREDHNNHGVFSRVARKSGVGSESLRTWVKRSELKLGDCAGMTFAERDELTKLRREVTELRRANAQGHRVVAFSFVDPRKVAADLKGVFLRGEFNSST